MKNNDIKLTTKNLKIVVDFITSHLENENGEYDEKSGVVGAITNAIGHIIESDNIKLDK